MIRTLLPTLVLLTLSAFAFGEDWQLVREGTFDELSGAFQGSQPPSDADLIGLLDRSGGRNTHEGKCFFKDFPEASPADSWLTVQLIKEGMLSVFSFEPFRKDGSLIPYFQYDFLVDQSEVSRSDIGDAFGKALDSAEEAHREEGGIGSAMPSTERKYSLRKFSAAYYLLKISRLNHFTQPGIREAGATPVGYCQYQVADVTFSHPTRDFQSPDGAQFVFVPPPPPSPPQEASSIHIPTPEARSTAEYYCRKLGGTMVGGVCK